LIETIVAEIDTDDESYWKKGIYLLTAYLENDIDDILISLTGWSMKSLLIKAGLILDDEGIYIE